MTKTELNKLAREAADLHEARITAEIHKLIMPKCTAREMLDSARRRAARR